jgi:hypothetical protein
MGFSQSNGKIMGIKECKTTLTRRPIKQNCKDKQPFATGRSLGEQIHKIQVVTQFQKNM